MREEQSSYREIMKATTLFGGVQIFTIILAVIRTKIIATLLGPLGMGISGLLQTTSHFIVNLTNFGLGTSAVKNIAEAHSTGKSKKVSTIIIVLRRWIWITGLLGTSITIAFSPWLSQITFGNKDYTFAFIWISVTILFTQLSSGQIVLLQGMRKLKHLANANLTGSLLGLVISVPIYYIWGIDGIVPTIILSSFASMLRTWYFARKIKVEPVRVSWQKTKSEGQEMLKMGFILSLSGIISAGDQYLLRIYISNTGGVDEVGLFSAAFVVLNSYIGMVLSAMAKDYYPRLSSINKNPDKTRILVSQQATTGLLLLIPIVLIFLPFANLIIQILYSSEFLSIIPLMKWAILGMYFRAFSWSLGYVPIAKGDSKMVIFSSLVSHLISLANNVIAYKFFGLKGLGISFSLNSFIYLIGMLILTGKKYNLKFQPDFYLVFIKGFLFCLLGLLVSVFTTSTLLGYSLGIIIFIIGSTFSFYEINKRMNLKEVFANIQRKFNSGKTF